MDTSKGKVIVIDMKDDIKRHLKKDSMYDFSKTVRDLGINIYRHISANRDRTASKLFGIDASDNSNKTILDICFPSQPIDVPYNKEVCQRELDEAVITLRRKGFKVLKSLLFERPEENRITGKILIDLVIKTAEPKKSIVTNRK